MKSVFSCRLVADIVLGADGMNYKSSWQSMTMRDTNFSSPALCKQTHTCNTN